MTKGTDKGKGKGKVHPRTGHVGPEMEQRYGSALSLTSALDGGVWSTRRPGRFTSRERDRYPLDRRLGGPQGWSGRVRKISPPPGQRMTKAGRNCIKEQEIKMV
jgi:hypothetical protein